MSQILVGCQQHYLPFDSTKFEGGGHVANHVLAHPKSMILVDQILMINQLKMVGF